MSPKPWGDGGIGESGNRPPLPADVTPEIRRRQRARAILMAVLLGAFVVLVYFITIAKMSLYGE